MERRVVAFAPGHISGYFQRVDGRSPGTTGSIGAGIVIDKGVTVTMKPAGATCVCIKNSTSDGWLVREVLSSLGVAADVSVTPAMPIGAGFGMSAAGLLATYHAANRLFDLGMSAAEIAAQAHAFEVRHGTGLGDVAAAAGGGVVVRTSAGIGGVKLRMFPDDIIYAVTLGGISTPDVITSPAAMEKVRAAFPPAEPKTIAEVIANSRSFTEKSGLETANVKKILAACDSAGVPASMTMLGDGVFAAGEAARGVLAAFAPVYTLRVSKTGPEILEDVHV
ncbi:MAG: GHMP kinase [Methanocorpusculum sp.]|nr:GHMP kinase [Methanocorpusculum sp.]